MVVKGYVGALGTISGFHMISWITHVLRLLRPLLEAVLQVVAGPPQMLELR